jgi:hypothetical protein
MANFNSSNCIKIFVVKPGKFVFVVALEWYIPFMKDASIMQSRMWTAVKIGQILGSWQGSSKRLDNTINFFAPLLTTHMQLQHIEGKKWEKKWEYTVPQDSAK